MPVSLLEITCGRPNRKPDRWMSCGVYVGSSLGINKASDPWHIINVSTTSQLLNTPTNGIPNESGGCFIVGVLSSKCKDRSVRKRRGLGSRMALVKTVQACTLTLPLDSDQATACKTEK